MVFSNALLQPLLTSFFVGCQASLGISLEVGDVEAVLGEPVNLCKELPRICDGFSLERNGWIKTGIVGV